VRTERQFGGCSRAGAVPPAEGTDFERASQPCQHRASSLIRERPDKQLLHPDPGPKRPKDRGPGRRTKTGAGPTVLPKTAEIDFEWLIAVGRPLNAQLGGWPS